VPDNFAKKSFTNVENKKRTGKSPERQKKSLVTWREKGKAPPVDGR
jgi:hypothetical protein